jgi:SPP1 family phage portal protein
LFEKYAEMIESQGITPEIIADIIADHAQFKADALKKYGRYKQSREATPILTREFEGEAAKKINNKLANDFFGEIVDTKVGYMFGNPVNYMYDKQEQGHEMAAEQIEKFKKINNLDDFNAENCKFSSICGYDAGLLYIDKEGQERVMRIDPWEAVIISRTEITEPEYGLRYYKTWDDKARVEFYDSVNKYVFEGNDFTASNLTEVENKPHLFDHCPLFGIPNNAELMGDGDKVFTLIDGYDRSLSDMNSEIEQFRLAYMLFIGYEPTEEQIRDMIKTGALWIPDAANGERIEWLTKQLDPKYVDSHLNRLEANITRFAKHVNFTDEQFAGNLSGVAMRFKLFALETKAKYFERKHEAATLYMFKVLQSAWEKKGIPFDYTKLDLKYTRNIPVNIVDEAQAAITLAGITSKQTALSTLSFVTDVEEEMERIRQEQEEMMDLDKIDLEQGEEDETDE